VGVYTRHHLDILNRMGEQKTSSKQRKATEAGSDPDGAAWLVEHTVSATGSAAGTSYVQSSHLLSATDKICCSRHQAPAAHTVLAEAKRRRAAYYGVKDCPTLPVGQTVWNTMPESGGKERSPESPAPFLYTRSNSKTARGLDARRATSFFHRRTRQAAPSSLQSSCNSPDQPADSDYTEQVQCKPVEVMTCVNSHQSSWLNERLQDRSWSSWSSEGHTETDKQTVNALRI